MGIEQEIESIRAGIQTGRFSNEAAVSQGIVMRLLAALSWPTFDTQVVWPEYSLSGRRVDYALCHPVSRPIAFIEVKQIGQGDGAERQLFEYAFHDGVPMAILTDGREWHFFLPAEQGDYKERRVYMLDIVERDVAECAARLKRYLDYSAIASGEAMQAARDDYRNVSRERQLRAALPVAFAKLIEEEDGMLLEVVADRVETLCGFKPDPDMVASYLKEQLSITRTFPMRQPNRPSVKQNNVVPAAPTIAIARITVPPGTGRPSETLSQIGFVFDGVFSPCRSAIGVLTQVLDFLSKRDPTFAERFAAIPHGRTRRYLAKNRDDLYPGRPDLCQEYSTQLVSGWWVSTNHSRQTIARIVEMACGVAKLRFDSELKVHLGEL
jgi:hypothetical protein